MLKADSAAQDLTRLSKRQREIAALVSAGRSNRSIADELFLSERTVENHVAAIYERLEVRSRVELTAVMIRLAYAGPAAPTRYIGKGIDVAEIALEQRPAFVAGNLPVQLTSFVGRDRELADLTAFFAVKRLVSLVGSGGVGKTRLALQAGTETLDSWPGGISLVELAEAKDHLSVAATLYSTLCHDAKGSLDTYDILVSVLQSRPRMLLILDNCEHVRAAVAAFVARVLEDCPDVCVLATSRQPIGIAGEQIYQLSSLDVPPRAEWQSLSSERARAYSSVSLFLDRTLSTNHTFRVTGENIPIICEIVSRLDGIALAIELAASCCNMLTVQEIRRRLDQRFELLAHGTETALSHHRTLRAAIDWSYELLSNEERLLARRLIAFSGDFSADAAEFVCSDDVLRRERVFSLLKSLVAQSLLTVEFVGEETRYRFLESMRSYLAETISPDEGQEDLGRRHAEWVASIASRLNERTLHEPVDALVQHFRAELDNIRAAIEWGFRPEGDLRLSGRIISELREFWFGAGAHDEWRRWSQAILDKLDERKDPDIVAAMYLALASVSSARSRVSATESAAKLLEPLGNARDLAPCFYHQTWGHMQAGCFDEAALSIEKSLRFYREAGMQNTSQFALAQCLRGDIERVQGKIGEARADYDRAVALCRLLGDEVAEIRVVVGIAELDFAQGNARAAIDVATAAVAIAERRRMIAEASLLLSNRAGYHVASGGLAEAKSDAAASLSLARAIHFEYAFPSAMQHLAAASASADAPRSALLAGYVDGWYRREAGVREPTERASYDILITELNRHLSADELGRLLASGADMSERQALSEADKLVAGARD